MKQIKGRSTIRTVVHQIGGMGLGSVLFLAASAGIAPAGQIKSFCESGYATSLEFGAAGAVWSQTWGKAAVPWFDCSAAPNVGFLNKKVTGLQTTQTSGKPSIDPNTLILSLPFTGNITLTALEDDDPAMIAGTIVGTMSGNFVADLNAAHAVITDQDITILFGQTVHSAPDALIGVTQTTGKFKSIQAVGDWEWHVSGFITIQRVPTLTPQQNIFAALQNSALLLGAEEEVVLSGSYVRGRPAK